ncbi:MAG: response regulator transcription factor [Candidatus Aminicenantes bacterium]|nr:response regulator transcription factor [Candidatus Aminicenantes bacterium]
MKKKLNILIVDDEQPARKKIISYLKRKGNAASVREAVNGIEAVRNIKENRPDLVFLDIQMPGMSGFDVIESIGVENMPAVIFVTAFDQYAVNAFEVQALDYLLKPFDKTRFNKSYSRAQERLSSGLSHPEVLQKLIDGIKKEKTCLRHILIQKQSRYFLVKTENIEYISSYEKYVRLHTKEGIFLLRKSMQQMEEDLDPSKFFRIHRTSIVNIDFIKEIQPWSHGDGIVILEDETQLPLSRRYRDRLFRRN